MTSHEQKVENVAKQVKAFSKQSKPVEFLKESVSHLVPNPYRDEDAIPKIDLRPLNQLLEINEEQMTCTAESGITFTDLTRATLAKNLIPYTVSELKTITIGGAVSGCSIESMSYKYGGFHDSCLEYEIVTGEGEILTCSPQDHPEIFHMIHGSYGTLGIITKIKFKLYPAKPYVKLENRLFDNFEDYWRELTERCKVGDYTFVDGIIHSPTQFVLCLGNMVDRAPSMSKYDWLEIYYKSTLSKREDCMSTYDYFFRYDAECHWLTKSVPPLEFKPVRFLVGKIFLGSTNLIKWSNRLRSVLKIVKKRPDVVVDVFIPSKRFEDFFKWYVTDFDFFPLWIVPYRMEAIYPWVDDEFARQTGDTFMIDAAIYGKPNTKPHIDYSDLLERKVYELKGIKTLISRNHYGEKTFWEIYNKPTIDRLKAKLDPRNLFGGLYEKFSPKNYS